MRSRRMPALLTRMSTRPKAASAALTISSAFLGSAIDSVEAIASPPAFLISSTTCCAGPASVPAPSRLAPMSQATTFAPSCAISSAMPRPMPRAAPVTMATFPATIPAILPPACVLTPHFVGDLDDHPKFGPLLVLVQRIAFLAGGKAALRAQTQLIEVNVFCRLVDAPLERILRFELTSLGCHQPEHDDLALVHAAQRLERAGAIGIVFHEIAV